MLWTVEADRLRAWIHYDRGNLEQSRERFEACLEAVRREPREFIPTRQAPWSRFERSRRHTASHLA